MNKKRYDTKHTLIVKNKIVIEEITFKNKKIKREKIVKEWDIPKIITDDIGFQLMFGFQPPFKPKKLQIDRDEMPYDSLSYSDRY